MTHTCEDTKFLSHVTFDGGMRLFVLAFLFRHSTRGRHKYSTDYHLAIIKMSIDVFLPIIPRPFSPEYIIPTHTHSCKHYSFSTINTQPTIGREKDTTQINRDPSAYMHPPRCEKQTHLEPFLKMINHSVHGLA
jgi:hypothetical protein